MRYCLALLLVAACGEVVATPPTPTESREVTAGGARLRGTTFTLDVQIGHSLRQTTVAGPKFVLDSNPAVRP
jgi:hypothetical protein